MRTASERRANDTTNNKLSLFMETRFESEGYIAGATDVLCTSAAGIVVAAAAWRYAGWWLALCVAAIWIYGSVLLARTWRRRKPR